MQQLLGPHFLLCELAKQFRTNFGFLTKFQAEFSHANSGWRQWPVNSFDFWFSPAAPVKRSGLRATGTLLPLHKNPQAHEHAHQNSVTSVWIVSALGFSQQARALSGIGPVASFRTG
jgi:hypothetical protein